MKALLDTGIYVGTVADYRETIGQGEWSYVSTTQTVHYEVLGCSRANRPDKGHPSYLVHEQGPLLSLNWVDGRAELYDWSGPKVFGRALDFIGAKRSGPVLVFCDQGLSRSPTLALLFLAKRLRLIPADSYESARKAFQVVYPDYAPGGIGEFVADNWSGLN